MQNKIIFLDVDGVLADFCGSALKLIGVDLAAPSEGADLTTKLKHTLIQSYVETGNREAFESIFDSAANMRRIIDAEGEKFWAEMPAYTHADDLVHAVTSQATRHGISVAFLTDPGYFQHSANGKLRFLSKWQAPLVLAKEKHLLAHPHALLIDDYRVNCGKFIAAGGAAYHWPVGEIRSEGVSPFTLVHSYIEVLANA